MKLAIVMPVLDEAAVLPQALARLQPLRARGATLIVVDGGSRDGSAAIAAPWADMVLVTAAGRARQMNEGAAAARPDAVAAAVRAPLIAGTVEHVEHAPRAAPGDGRLEALLFLHADTMLPDGADALIARALSGRDWGRFDVHIEGRSPVLRLVAALMNARSRLSGIATGDQALFVRRAAFEAVGGFPDQPLMEDIELSSRLKRRVGRPACLRARVRTSGRRWECRGVWRTIALMWRLRLAYWLGAAPERLARVYR